MQAEPHHVLVAEAARLLDGGGSPTRVLVAPDKSLPPSLAELVRVDVIYLRRDGWSLGAPEHLRGAAEASWREEWVAVIECPLAGSRSVRWIFLHPVYVQTSLDGERAIAARAGRHSWLRFRAACVGADARMEGVNSFAVPMERASAFHRALQAAGYQVYTDATVGEVVAEAAP